MEFYDTLDQVMHLLRSRGRVSYRALRLQFHLDDDHLEALKDELIKAQRLAVDEDGAVLIWVGEPAPVPPPAATQAQPPPVAIPAHLGEKIRAARADLEGERKQVTVLFADLKDSTRLIEGLDPEAARQLLDPALHLMMDAVHRYEGTVNQVLGDGIMALFGAPIAHEDHALRACYAALARSAHREAVGYFEQALNILPHLPEQRDTREQAIDLRLALRYALRPLGDFGRILTCLRQAEALAATLDDPRRLGQVSLILSAHFRIMGAHEQAIAASERALALTTSSGDAVLHALANFYLGMASHAQGDYHRAIDCLRKIVASLEGAQRRERLGQVFLPAVTSRVFLVWCHAELGTFAEGRALGDEGLRIAEAAAHPPSLMLAPWGIGQLALRQGDLLRALPVLERAVGLCEELELPAYFPGVAAALGAAYALGGRVADAVPLLIRALKQTTATESVYQALCHLSLGEAQMLAGRLEEARTLAKRILAFACERQERGHQAYALRLFGEIAARRGPSEVEQAEGHYQQALTLAEELGMRPLQAHCHLGLGTLYATTGQRDQACTALSTAIALYRAMDMTFWLPQAEAALAQAGGPEPSARECDNKA